MTKDSAGQKTPWRVRSIRLVNTGTEARTFRLDALRVDVRDGQLVIVTEPNPSAAAEEV